MRVAVQVQLQLQLRAVVAAGAASMAATTLPTSGLCKRKLRAALHRQHVGKQTAMLLLVLLLLLGAQLSCCCCHLLSASGLCSCS
jgi:hypothetical protein